MKATKKIEEETIDLDHAEQIKAEQKAAKLATQQAKKAEKIKKLQEALDKANVVLLPLQERRDKAKAELDKAKQAGSEAVKAFEIEVQALIHSGNGMGLNKDQIARAIKRMSLIQLG